MFSKFLIALIILFSSMVAEPAAVIFSGSSVKALKSKMAFLGSTAVFDMASNDISLEPGAGRYVLLPSNVLNIGSTAPPSSNLDINLDGTGVLSMKERTTTPTADATYHKVYSKDDDRIYYQDGAGGEHDLLASGLLVSQEFTFSGLGSAMTTTTGDIRWGTVPSTGPGILTYTDADGFFTANRDCNVVATAGPLSTGAAALEWRDSASATIQAMQTEVNAQNTLATTYKMSAGDKIKMNFGGTFNGASNHYLRIVATGIDTAVITSQEANDSYIKVSADNGNGSTNTAIRRFTTIDSSSGTAITYADSATLGASFTINEPGIYHVSYSADWNASGQSTGISGNSNQLSTDISSITSLHRLGYSTNSSVNGAESTSWVGPLSQGDVIRAHVGVSKTTGANPDTFSIAKLGFDALSAVTPININPAVRECWFEIDNPSGTASITHDDGCVASVSRTSLGIVAVTMKGLVTGNLMCTCMGLNADEVCSTQAAGLVLPTFSVRSFNGAALVDSPFSMHCSWRP